MFRSPRQSISCRREVRLTVEPLEARCLLAANIQLTSAYLVDPALNPLTTPVHGERIYMRANWKTTDLTTQDKYVVRFWVDGVALDSALITGSPGNDLSYYWWHTGWFASPGLHSATVTVDADNTVAEVNENDNSTSFTFTPVPPQDLPEEFQLPLYGKPFKAWTIVNYVDTDPTGGVSDYRGGPYAYNGHDAWDITLPNFVPMDAGVPIYAAAPGIVTFTQDGFFDRQTSCTGSPNYVVVSHGNGWVTKYLHLAMDTVAVKVGEAVTAGQMLGLMGSSGCSSEAHLHFTVEHNGATVETSFDPNAYWVSPLPYQGDTPPLVLDYDITNYQMDTAEVKERPSAINQFPSTYGGSVYFWHRMANLRPEHHYALNWYRPDGALDASYSFDPTNVLTFGWYWWTITRTWSLPQYQGTWHVVLQIDGQELAHSTFVIGHQTVPEVRVSQGSTYILDGRTTPIDYGSIGLGQSGPARTFTIANHGYAALTVSNPVMPPGFSLVGGFPSNIAAGTSTTFTVRLDTVRAGIKFGQVRFTTTDADETLFTFNVSGVVTGAPPPAAPLITLPGPAVALINRAPAKLIAPAATLNDSDSSHFASLVVAYASGGSVDDRLGIRNEGMSSGQIGTIGNKVTFGGLPMGRFRGGIFPAPLIIAFNDKATPAAVTALLRNITFVNDALRPITARRYIRFTLVDESGIESNEPIKTVLVGPRLPPAQPPSPAPAPGGPRNVAASSASVNTSMPIVDETPKDFATVSPWHSSRKSRPVPWSLVELNLLGVDAGGL